MGLILALMKTTRHKYRTKRTARETRDRPTAAAPTLTRTCDRPRSVFFFYSRREESGTTGREPEKCSEYQCGFLKALLSRSSLKPTGNRAEYRRLRESAVNKRSRAAFTRRMKCQNISVKSSKLGECCRSARRLSERLRSAARTQVIKEEFRHQNRKGY